MGDWGTKCTCPNGEEYWIGSIKAAGLELNNCLNFGCLNGVTSGECFKELGIWSKNKVTCYSGNYTGMAFLQIASHLPQIVMAYTFQFNLFSFYKSLDTKVTENADKKMLQITKRSLMSVCIIYLITSILGYISFGNMTQGKIIANINSSKEEFGTAFLTVFNLAFMCLSGLGFPMLFFNCRNFIVSVSMDIYFCIKSRKNKQKTELTKKLSMDTQDSNIIRGNDENELRVNRATNEIHARASEIMEDNPIDMGFVSHLSDEERREQKILNMIFNGVTSV